MTVILGVQTRADTARAALDANNAKATALIDVLKGSGVAAADLHVRGGDAAGDVARSAELPSADHEVLPRILDVDINIARGALLAFGRRRDDLKRLRVGEHRDR